MFTRTARLLLRPPFPEDWREVYSGINDAGVVRMLARAPWPYAPEDAQAFCNAQRVPQRLRVVRVHGRRHARARETHAAAAPRHARSGRGWRGGAGGRLLQLGLHRAGMRVFAGLAQPEGQSLGRCSVRSSSRRADITGESFGCLGCFKACGLEARAPLSKRAPCAGDRLRGFVFQKVQPRVAGLLRVRDAPHVGAVGEFAGLDAGIPAVAGYLAPADAARLATMQPHAMIVNSARGQLIVEADLAAALESGDSLILFPEGTRNTTDELLLPMKSGIYHLAQKCPQIDLVPVWMENLGRLLPKGEIVPVPLLCSISFGTPLRLQPGEDKETFLARIRDALLATMRDARPSES